MYYLMKLINFEENILHILYMNELNIIIRTLEKIESIYNKIKEVYSTFGMNMNKC